MIMMIMIRGSDEYNIKILSTMVTVILKQLKTEISKRLALSHRYLSVFFYMPWRCEETQPDL